MRSVLSWSFARIAMAIVAVGVAALAMLGGAASAGAATPGQCSWQGQFGNGGANALATDTDASYWATTYLATLNEGMTIQGTFPEARYMSFTLYGLNGSPVAGGHLYDAQIQPSSGVNPFQFGEVGTGTYTLRIVSGPDPAIRAANTLYTGTSNPLVDLQLIYRIYDPDPGTGATGGVPLPASTVTLGGHVVAVNQPCVTPYAIAPKSAADTGGDRAVGTATVPKRDRTAAGKRVARRRARVSHARRTQVSHARRTRISHARRTRVSHARRTRVSHARRTRNSVRRGIAHRAIPIVEPTWVSGDAIFFNPDNAYLTAAISQLEGQLVVFQATVPTFPDTNTGDEAWDPATQVRYWSFCEDTGLIPSVVACAADFDSVQTGGVATFVVSTPADRPANATAADGVNWLPWGSSSRGLIYYRQMLANTSFGEAIAAVPAGSSPLATMGSFLPQIAYCSEAEFEAAGAAGCLSS